MRQNLAQGVDPQPIVKMILGTTSYYHTIWVLRYQGHTVLTDSIQSHRREDSGMGIYIHLHRGQRLVRPERQNQVCQFIRFGQQFVAFCRRTDTQRRARHDLCLFVAPIAYHFHFLSLCGLLQWPKVAIWLYQLPPQWRYLNRDS